MLLIWLWTDRKSRLIQKSTTDPKRHDWSKKARLIQWKGTTDSKRHNRSHEKARSWSQRARLIPKGTADPISQVIMNPRFLRIIHFRFLTIFTCDPGPGKNSSENGQDRITLKTAGSRGPDLKSGQLLDPTCSIPVISMCWFLSHVRLGERASWHPWQLSLLFSLILWIGIYH